MSKVAVVFWSGSGNTEAMDQAVSACRALGAGGMGMSEDLIAAGLCLSVLASAAGLSLLKKKLLEITGHSRGKNSYTTKKG